MDVKSTSDTTAAAYRDRVALVTGGFGFMGSNLVPRLVEVGAEVRIMARSWPPQVEFDEGVHPQVRFFKGDIRDESVLQHAVEGCDYVFHFAGKSGASTSNESPIEDLDVNCRGLLLLLDAMRLEAPNAVIVFPSSRLVYAPNLPLPVVETSQTMPISVYGAHKLVAESYLRIFGRHHGLKSVILRMTNPYGPHQRPEQHSYGVINQFIYEAVAGRTIKVFGEGEQLRDYIHVDDVVDAVLLAASTPNAAGATYNLGSGTGTSLAKLAGLIVEVAGSGRVEHVPWPNSEASVETGDFCADINRIKDGIGWAPRIELRDGIRDVITRVHRSPRRLG